MTHSDSTRADYDACYPAPFAVLGLRTQGTALAALDFLPLARPALAPRTRTAERAARLLDAYLADPATPFDIPLAPRGTPFQQRVWSALCGIPVGQVLSYGELARQLGTAARALGGACGRNPIALIIPCHRVVAASGALGGFMGGHLDFPLAVKRWLLLHERALPHV